MNKVIIYAKSIVVPLLIGGLVGVITTKYIDYTSLSQPSWAPPSFLFPIVWTFVWILLLIILVYLMIKDFYSKNKVAGLLQLPYLLWIIFASFLNLAVYLLNS